MVFLSHLYINAIFLPRQARDKHRKTQKKTSIENRFPSSAVPASTAFPPEGSACKGGLQHGLWH